MSKVKCRQCKNEIEKDNAIKDGKALYFCCQDCYDKYIENRNKKKIKYEPKENTDRLKLTNYIQELYLNEGFSKNEIPWQMMMTQTKKMIDEYKYSYASIKYVLWYEVEILGLNLFNEQYNGSILNLIPYHFQEAKDFCEKNIELKKEIENFDFTDEVIVINKTYQKIDKRKDLDFE